jgi:hypothetical protein
LCHFLFLSYRCLLILLVNLFRLGFFLRGAGTMSLGIDSIGSDTTISNIAGLSRSPDSSSVDPTGSVDPAAEFQRQMFLASERARAQTASVGQNAPQSHNASQFSNSATDANPRPPAAWQRYAGGDEPSDGPRYWPNNHDGSQATPKEPPATTPPEPAGKPPATLQSAGKAPPSRPGTGVSAGIAVAAAALGGPAAVGPHRLTTISNDFLAHQQPLTQNFGPSLQLQVYSDEQRGLDPNAKSGTEAKGNFFKVNSDGTTEKLPVDVQINEMWYPRSPGQPLDRDSLAFDPGQLESASRAAGLNLDELSAADREYLGLPKLATQAQQTPTNWGTGPLRAPARPLLNNENVLIDASHGLQSRLAGAGPFQNVTTGMRPDGATKYLWTVDERGVNIGLEKTPFPTPRGNIVHTNLSEKASIGGEAWFGPENSVTINAGSGRFGDGAGITPQQWDAAVKLWESLGYKVNPVPFGER